MSFLDKFRHWKDVEEFEPGVVIFSKGEPADFVYVILAGEVELSLHGEPLSAEGEGNIIGEMAMIESATRNATAIARTHVALAKLDRQQFQKMASESPEFSLRAMAVLANRLRAVDQFIILQLDQQATVK